MAFSTSSEVGGVSVNFDNVAKQVNNLYIEIQNDADISYVNLDFQDGVPPESGTDGATNIGIAQQIYASDDGFRDENDAEVTPIVHGYPHGTTVESLDDFGYWNPLKDSTSHTDRLKMMGDLQRKATREEDSDTGRPKWQHTIDFEAVTEDISADEFSQALGEWYISQVGTDNINFDLEVFASEEWTSSTWKQNRHVRALIAWLNTLHSGTDIPESTWTDSDFSGVSFSVAQVAGQTAMVFEYSESQATDAEDSGYITDIQLKFQRTSGQALNTDNIDALMDITSATIDRLSGDQNIPTIGGIDAPLMGSRLQIGGMELVPIDEKEMELRGRDPGGDKFKVPLGGYGGRVIYYDELPDVTGEANTKKLIRHTFKDLIYFEGTSESTLRLDTPGDHIRTNDTYRRYPIHNNTTEYDLKIEDWDGNLILTLRPTQSCTLYIILKDSGDGEVLIRDVPPRRLQLTIGIEGETLADSNVTRFTDSSSTFRMFQVFISHHDTILRRDTDTFRFGSANNRGQSYVLADHTDWEMRDVLRITKGGYINIFAHFDASVSGTGNIPNWNGLYLYKVENGTTSAELVQWTKGPTVSAGEPLSHFLQYRDVCEPEDRFFFVIRAHTSATITWSNVNVDRILISISLETVINQEWSSA